MSKQHKSRKKSLGKSFIKLLLKHNPFDPAMAWGREYLNLLGMTDLFDANWHWSGWNLFRNLFKALWGYDVKGRGNFPEYGPGIVISNHQSEFDPYFVGTASHRWVRWVSKEENFQIPILKSIIKPFGVFPLKRGANDQKALKQIMAILENDGVVGIFPEGTRSATGTLSPFHKGPARFCLMSGAPYIPCCISGAYEILPKSVNFTKAKFFGKNKISVVIGKPVHIDPDIEINFENLTLLAAEMRKDVRLLQMGKMNKARVIRMSDLVQKAPEIKAKEQEFFDAPIEIPSTSFDPVVDFSLS